VQRTRTQRAMARMGEASPEMIAVARDEGLDVEEVREALADGTAVIPANPGHRGLRPTGIGASMRVKVNVNLGRSPTTSCLSEEVEKVRVALRHGADAVMDLSVGPDVDEVRKAVIEACPAPLGTVPLYQAATWVREIEDLPLEAFFEVIERQAAQGVDFMTIHAGLRREFLPLADRRVTGIVSRGGALLARWMVRNDRENPYWEHFDRVLEIAARHDVTLSLGDGLRPGCLADASDAAQFAELQALGTLTLRAWDRDVQVMIEGPGHVPLDQVVENVRRQKEVCHGAPFYVLGPLVTDVAAGYDHVAGAIGGALAATAGADFLCYVTPKEHLGLPQAPDVREGLMAFRIAAHAADIARGRPGARERDDRMARARASFDWESQFALALDPDRAREYHDQSLPEPQFRKSRYCSMCGDRFCAMRNFQDAMHPSQEERNP